MKKLYICIDIITRALIAITVILVCAGASFYIGLKRGTTEENTRFCNALEYYYGTYGSEHQIFVDFQMCPGSKVEEPKFVK